MAFLAPEQIRLSKINMDVVQDIMMTGKSHGMRQTNIVYQKEKDFVIHKTNLTSAVTQAAPMMLSLFGLELKRVG